jgi:hypothetical protein
MDNVKLKALKLQTSDLLASDGTTVCEAYPRHLWGFRLISGCVEWGTPTAAVFRYEKKLEKLLANNRRLLHLITIPMIGLSFMSFSSLLPHTFFY